MTNPMPRSAERTRASGIEGGMCDLGVDLGADEVEVVNREATLHFQRNQYMNQYQRRSVTSTTRASGALEHERTASVTASAVALDLRSAMM